MKRTMDRQQEWVYHILYKEVIEEDQRKDLIDSAMQWAKSPEARGMPGYIGSN